MKYELLNNEAITDIERNFVETCSPGNKSQQQQIASSIYTAAINRKAASDMISAANRISKSNSLSSWAMIALTVALVIAAFKSAGNETYANRLNSILVENSRRDLENYRKKLSFDIINTLYKDFYQFGDYNAEVIRKLKAKEQISNEYNLAVYLNGFEDLYEQCKRGLISREDVRVHFEFLVGPTCNNSQVEKVIGDHGNGLKLLCNSFYPNSRLARRAKIEKDACN